MKAIKSTRKTGILRLIMVLVLLIMAFTGWPVLPGYAEEGGSGSGARLGNFEGMTAGIGPMVSYATKICKTDLVAEVKWLPELLQSIQTTEPANLGVANRTDLALVNQERLRRILTRMVNENEFLSPYGIRGLSRYTLEHPSVFHVQGEDYRVQYLPAEPDPGMFGADARKGP